MLHADLPEEDYSTVVKLMYTFGLKKINAYQFYFRITNKYSCALCEDSLVPFTGDLIS